MNNENEIKKIMNPNKNSFTSSDLGIRAGLNALGFNNNEIGWDGENVTYQNKPIFKPDKNVDGTTKINTKGFIEGVNKIYGNSGNSLADVTAYAAGTGISNLVEYGGDGSISIAGIQVPNAIIIDGQAYASTADIKKAVTMAFGDSTAYSPHNIFNKYYGENGKYTESADKLIDRIVNREEFEYDPEEDPAYRAYKDMYIRNGEEARDDTYGSLAARTGGYANSAAIAAADNAYFSYIRALNDKIPELYKDAYNRYQKNFENDVTALTKTGSPKDIYGYEKTAGRNMRSDINDAMKSDYERNIDSRDFSQLLKEFEAEQFYNKQLLQNKSDEFEHRKAQDAISNSYMEQQIAINAMANAQRSREIAIKEDENKRKSDLHDYEKEKLIAQIMNLKN